MVSLWADSAITKAAHSENKWQKNYKSYNNKLSYKCKITESIIHLLYLQNNPVFVSPNQCCQISVMADYSGGIFDNCHS